MRHPLLLLVFGSAATFLPMSPQALPRPDDLLGKPLAAAIDRYGPPEGGDGTTGLVAWRWKDDEGGSLQLSVHAGLVVCVDTSRLRGDITPRAVAADGVHPGLTVAEMLVRLGAPIRVHALGPVAATPSSGPSNTRLDSADAVVSYENQRLLIAAGYVLGPVPPAPKVQGPR